MATGLASLSMRLFGKPHYRRGGNIMLYTADWYWKYALLSLAGWLLLFGILVLLTKDMSSDAYLLTNYMGPDAYPFDLSSRFSTP
jgi:hypothetical protein